MQTDIHTCTQTDRLTDIHVYKQIDSKDRKICRSTDKHTSPIIVSEMSISVMSCMKLVATERRASFGHSENQSMVQQFTRLGN